MDTSALKELRKHIGQTQEGFAQLLGVSTATVRKWERGANKPSPMALERIVRLRNRLERQQFKGGTNHG